MKLIKLLILFTVSISVLSLSAVYAEQVELPFEPVDKNCIYMPDSIPPQYACVWLGSGMIDVRQDNLTSAEIKTLDEIPRAQNNTENDAPSKFTPVKSQRLTDEDFIEESEKALVTICAEDSIYSPSTKKLLGCQYEIPPNTQIVNPNGTMNDYYNNLSPMQKYAQYRDNPTEFESDDSYGKVGWKKMLKGMRSR